MLPRCRLCQQKIFHKRGLKIGLCTKCICGIEPVIYSKKLTSKSGYSFSFFALYAYKDTIREMIKSFKFYRDLKLAGYLSALILENTDLSFGPDIIVPVPSHPIEDIKRGFSHMGYLAFVLSKRMDIVFYDGLKRSFFPVFGRTQKARSKSQRIKKDLHLYLKEKSSIKDKKILLIDDVTTTGSSIKACADILLQNGAKKVYAVCLGLTPY